MRKPDVSSDFATKNYYGKKKKKSWPTYPNLFLACYSKQALSLSPSLFLPLSLSLSLSLSIPRPTSLPPPLLTPLCVAWGLKVSVELKYVQLELGNGEQERLGKWFLFNKC